MIRVCGAVGVVEGNDAQYFLAFMFNLGLVLSIIIPALKLDDPIMNQSKKQMDFFKYVQRVINSLTSAKQQTYNKIALKLGIPDDQQDPASK